MCQRMRSSKVSEIVRGCAMKVWEVATYAHMNSMLQTDFGYLVPKMNGLGSSKFKRVP